MSKKDRSVFYVLLNTDRKTGVPIMFISAEDISPANRAARAATPDEIDAALLAANVPAAAIDRGAADTNRKWREDVGVWSSRSAARAAAAKVFGESGYAADWKVVVIQVGKVDREFKKPTGWRVDYYSNGELKQGCLRFRTRKAARDTAPLMYESGGYKVNPHFDPIEHFYA